MSERDCRHGHQARVCDACELEVLLANAVARAEAAEAERDDARSDLAVLRAAVAVPDDARDLSAEDFALECTAHDARVALVARERDAAIARAEKAESEGGWLHALLDRAKTVLGEPCPAAPPGDTAACESTQYEPPAPPRLDEAAIVLARLLPTEEEQT